MVLWRNVLLCALLVVSSLGARELFAQEGASSVDLKTALKQLKETPTHQKRAVVVAHGEQAVEPLLAIINDRHGTDALAYIGQCITALGELKARSATDALLLLLDGATAQYAYQASRALGQIWEKADAAEPPVRPLNAALLSPLFFQKDSVASYGPALALLKINDIRIDRPLRLTPGKLRDQIEAWFSTHPEALPTAAERPWQLNLHAALTEQDAAARQGALQALRQKRTLQPVDAILEALNANSALSDATRADLGRLLGELTGLPYPPKTADANTSRAAAADKWRKLWWKELPKHPESKYIDYAWRSLENSLLDYDRAPSDSAAVPLKTLRAVLLSQLNAPQDIPTGASRRLVGILAPPLRAKKQMTDSVQIIERSASELEKSNQLATIEEYLGRPDGQEAAVFLLDRLARLANDEMNTMIARRLGKTLWRISKVPCQLEARSRDGRRAALRMWAAKARQKGLPIQDH